MHSIIFAARSLAFMMIIWVERRFLSTEVHRDYCGVRYYCSNVAVVFVTLLLSDISTSLVEVKYRSNSVRDVKASATYKYTASWVQFLYTTNCLVGVSSYRVHFVVVFVLQVRSVEHLLVLTLLRATYLFSRPVSQRCLLSLSRFNVRIWYPIVRCLDSTYSRCDHVSVLCAR
jgi:hypothetical protein